MHIPSIGICSGPENLAIIEHAGADFMEANVQNFLLPGESDERFTSQREAASRSGFPIRCANCFLPASLPCVGPAVDETALVAYVETAFARAREIGIHFIVFGSGGSRRVPEGFSLAQAREQFVGLLQKIAPLAENTAVTVVVEPLHAKECNFINTVQEGAEIVAACGHTNVGLMADTFHMGFSAEGPEELRKFGRLLRHIHVAEYPSRHFPGADGGSYRTYFKALREIGYVGGISVECNWGNIADEARQAVANLRRDLAAAGWR